MEVWKRFRDTIYLVSTKGRIKNELSGYILQGSETRGGYRHFSTYHNGEIKTRKVHRMIAEAFIENPKNSPYVNHKDGVKWNNNVDNLEWVTPHENSIHAVEMGLFSQGEKHGLSILKEADIPKIRKMLAEGIKNTEIAKLFGVSSAAIGHIKLGDTWKHVPHEKLENIVWKGKLKPSDIPIIRDMLSKGISKSIIGSKFGVHRGTISNIKTGRIWNNY